MGEERNWIGSAAATPFATRQPSLDSPDYPLEESVVSSPDSFVSSQVEEWKPYSPQLDTRPGYQAPDPKLQFVPADESERTPEVVSAQEKAVGTALADGKPVTFTNAEGSRFSMKLRKVGSSYLYRSGKDRLKITLGSDLSAEQRRRALAQIVDYYSQEPAHLRSNVQQVVVESPLRKLTVRAGDDVDRMLLRAGHRRPFPDDLRQRLADANPGVDLQALKAGQRLSMPRPGGGANMSGPDKVMRIEGSRWLDESYFRHEFGHAVGYSLTADYMPNRWQALAKADKAELSIYGASRNKNGTPNRVEDFAEAYLAYAEARESGPEALAALKKRFPNRMEELEKIYENRR